ncbi:hypothetical protein EDC04DRAFT_948757 [Pisolithus marmoratus]|nr:hypothetical protein EDC04DRAFT_948757 [Pisolithus marmoratus]
MVGSYQASGERAPLSPSNKPRYQEKPCTVGAPTIPVPWRSHAGFPNTAAFFGHQDGVQSTGHYNDLPHSSLPHTASVPAQTIPPVISDRVNPPTYPAASQGHLRPSQLSTPLYNLHGPGVSTRSATALRRSTALYVEKQSRGHMRRMVGLELSEASGLCPWYCQDIGS